MSYSRRGKIRTPKRIFPIASWNLEDYLTIVSFIL